MTQFEIIKSRSVLEAVIKKHNLQQKWGEPTIESAYRKLLKMMDLREVRGTDMIFIVVYSTDPEEAALLANSIAAEYRTPRRNFHQERVESDDIPITIWEKAEPSSVPARPSVSLNMLLSCVIGLFLGCVLAFIVVRPRPKQFLQDECVMPTSVDK